MTNALREAVRRAYQHRCGYCGVHENEAGCELEIDHFRPVSKGGGDESENLVYCCTACNRHKADFWPTAENLAAQQRLLHPQQDDYAVHLREEPDGGLAALTATGTFHIARLHLNRLPLIAYRRNQRIAAAVLQRMERWREGQNYWRDRLARDDEELSEMLEQMSRLFE